MTVVPAPLVRNQALETAQDFYELRRRGIGFIEEMGSAYWTDFNVHDPGITILEAAAYALTDLAYRMSWDITDILAPALPAADPLDPYPDQAFFTARRILTVNPTTPDDFRRLLIDLNGVRDAWVTCKHCACEASYFAWCDTDKDEIALGYAPPADKAEDAVEVFARGLYEALLELKGDAELGDLNDRKIVHNYTFRDGAKAYPVTMEFRFPEVSLVSFEAWKTFLEDEATFADPNAFAVVLTRLGATKTFDVFTGLATAAERDDYIRRHWRDTFYLDFRIEAPAGTAVFTIDNVALRVFGATGAKNGATAADWRQRFETNTAAGIVARYRRKAIAAAAAIAAAKEALQSHRNLDEDYCTVRGVGVEEIAVCADVEVEPGADIEKVQAQIWFALSRYFNPPVPFRTLAELRAAGVAVEDIFNGPELSNGFIEQADLEAAALRRELRVSDIINLLMDIDGVIAVNQLLLTKYDDEGNVVKGAADPIWVGGQPVFDATKISAQWLLFVSPGCQPRLYLNQSRFVFYKNGLPFMPRMDEATATLNELTGAAERLKIPGAPNDLRIPAGNYRNPEAYYPIQYSLPPAYGIGPAGLPSTATPERRSQANNLKAYMMVFEQIIANALAQFAHSGELFSLDPAVARTYFVKAFDAAAIAGFADIAKPGLTENAVGALAETREEFLERRNVFLDHLLARFGENFGEYALLLTGANGEKVAQEKLIGNKIAFLKRYPQISHDRGKAFDYSANPCAAGNDPGIKTRINLLLGFPDLAFVFTAAPAGPGFTVDFQLLDGHGGVVLAGSVDSDAAGEDAASAAAHRHIVGRMVQDDAWEIAAAGPKSRLRLLDEDASEIAQHPALFDTKEEAAALRDELIAWSANHRLIVVEHLLLRPKFPGDALFPACCEDGCCLCGEEDPYSFRLTFVMPGWTPQYTGNLDLRRFADRTIRQETPSHLLAKICWVGNDGFIDTPCDGSIEGLADLLQEEGKTAGGEAPTAEQACACATAIHTAFNDVFEAWYEDKTLLFMHRDALEAKISALFAADPAPNDIECEIEHDAALFAKVKALMVAHFTSLAADGWQFERFEDAWCRWLEENAAIDWTEERMQARVEAILSANLATANPAPGAVCTCARLILADYGQAFSDWLDLEIRNGTAFEALGAPPQQAVALCPGLQFKAGTAAAVAALLNARYVAYRDVSYWLRVVVALLAGLRNTYPGATLHDCDDGSDHNPVRLDNTALGNYPRRTMLT